MRREMQANRASQVSVIIPLRSLPERRPLLLRASKIALAVLMGTGWDASLIGDETPWVVWRLAAGGENGSSIGRPCGIVGSCTDTTQMSGRKSHAHVLEELGSIASGALRRPMRQVVYLILLGAHPRNRLTSASCCRPCLPLPRKRTPPGASWTPSGTFPSAWDCATRPCASSASTRRSPASLGCP